MTTRVNIAAIAIAALMASAAVSPVWAQSGSSPAAKGYMDAMSKMQASMPKDHTGDADKDFARMMIPHHQGAIDMAKVEVQYGKNPKMKEMAQKIIKESESGISELRKELDKK